jgi:hypothetical protein
MVFTPKSVYFIMEMWLLQRVLANHPVIVLKDMKFSVLKSLVEFMYCGETSVTEENLTPLLEAAKFFEASYLLPSLLSSFLGSHYLN